MSTNLTELPTDLPRPLDDGAADHLVSQNIPALDLLSTNGRSINTSNFSHGLHIIFAYPMTGQPGVNLPDGWNSIPGARGCTPEILMFTQAYDELKKLGFSLAGLSTQTSDYQKEMTGRLQVPFEILSDAGGSLTEALGLPTMIVAGQTMLKRLTLVVRDGVIIKVFYPVFPPDKHPGEVLNWARHYAARLSK